jgi:hypothetical protein
MIILETDIDGKETPERPVSNKFDKEHIGKLFRVFWNPLGGIA